MISITTGHLLGFLPVPGLVALAFALYVLHAQ